MTGPLYAIGRFCSRQHWLVIGLWVAAALALVLVSQAAGSKTSENLTLPGTGSTKATELLEQNLPEQAYGSNPMVLVAPRGRLTEARYSAAIAETAKRLNRLGYVNSAIDPLSPQAHGLLSKDGTVAYIPVVLSLGPGEIDQSQAQAVLNASGPARAAGIQASVGGYVGQQLSKPATESSEVDRHSGGDRHPGLRLRHRDGDDAPDLLCGARPRLRALDHPPAGARGRSAGRLADAGHDDRPRSGDRLRAVHRHPAQTPTSGRDGDAGVDRSRRRDRGRRRPLRRAPPS